MEVQNQLQILSEVSKFHRIGRNRKQFQFVAEIYSQNILQVILEGKKDLTIIKWTPSLRFPIMS